MVCWRAWELGAVVLNARQPTSGHACWLYAFKYRLIVRFVSKLGAQSANQGTRYGSRLPAVLVLLRRAVAMVVLQLCWALLELLGYHSSCVSLRVGCWCCVREEVGPSVEFCCC